MNLLLDELPYSVVIAGKEMPINADYRTGILFEQVLDDMGMEDNEKLEAVLELYYGADIFTRLTDIDEVQEALAGIMWFYRCGADEMTRDKGRDGSSAKEVPFSYTYDAGYIYAAFLEAYSIDLTKNRLHWWQFRALFLGLPETVLLCRIMGYRTMEIPAKMPKAQKEFYRRMKRVYKLPETSGQTRLERELESALAEGGDITQFMEWGFLDG